MTFKFMCCQRRQIPESNFAMIDYANIGAVKNFCKFFLVYRLNCESLHFTLSDYDEIHSHPLDETLDKSSVRNGFKKASLINKL